MAKRRGLRIATIRGVDLRIHSSLVLLMLYIALVTTAQFPLIVEGSGIDLAQLTGTPLTWSILFSFGLFASVALHEFGHTIAAQRQGVKVESITLMMLGGMTEMEKIPEKKYAELKLSLVGPFVSLALGFMLFAAQGFTESPNLYFFCYWLGNVNLFLGIFNLIPAFPLDGGRAMRSYFAARHGMLPATEIAVRVSKFFALGFGIMGIVGFNILLLLIAFFIYSAAQSELIQLQTRGLLQGLKVSDVTVRMDPVDERDTIRDTAAYMLRSRNSVVPVQTEMSNGSALVTLDGLRRIQRGMWHSTRVREVMHKAQRALDIDEPVTQALPDLMANPLRTLAVQEGGKIIGILRYTDLTEALQLRALENMSAMRTGRAA